MVNTVKSNAGEIFENYVKSHGIKKVFVADKLGITPQTLNNKIHGQNDFDADFALKVSKALNIKPSVFLSNSYTNSLKRSENN